MRSDGRVRRFFELGVAASRQTEQAHPRVGTPIDVPLPRKVRVACILLADDARAGGWGAGLFGGGLAGEELGYFEEAHAGFEDGGLQ